MPSEVATTRKRKTAVRIQKIQDEVYTTVDIDEAPEEIQNLAGALLEHISCCEPTITDVRSFNGFGDDTYWQIGISHEMLIDALQQPAR